MSSLPKPLVPANVDLRDFAFMPLDVKRLRDSDLAAVATDAEFRAAVMLWCAAWHQVPAGSLPDDDRTLAHLAGLGRNVAQFEDIRDMAVRGFAKCSDGRLYHNVICEKVTEAWNRKNSGAVEREAGRQRKKKWRERKAQLNQQPGHEGQDGDGTGTESGQDNGLSENEKSMKSTLVSRGTERGRNRDKVGLSQNPATGVGSPLGKAQQFQHSCPADVPSMTGTGTETIKKQDAAGAAQPDLTDPKTQFYHRGRQVLGKSAGGQLTKLLTAMEDNVARARAAIETASTKAEPRAYVARVIERRDEEISDAESEPLNPVLTL